MGRTVDADTAAALDRLRVELPRAVASLRAEEVAHLGSQDSVPDPHDLALRIDVQDDGLPDLVVECVVHRTGSRPPRARARFRFDAEWRRAAEAVPDGLANRVARGLVLGDAYETDSDEPTTQELAGADAAMPDAATLWDDLVRRTRGVVDADGNLVVGRTVVLVTAEQWREHVLGWEVAARRDRGSDALRPGDGPAAASADLMDTLVGPGFVMWWRGRPHPSRRAALPPV